MSINSLPDNPIILAEIAAALPRTDVSLAGLIKYIYSTAGSATTDSSTGTITLMPNQTVTGLVPGDSMLFTMATGYYGSGGIGVIASLNMDGTSIATAHQATIGNGLHNTITWLPSQAATATSHIFNTTMIVNPIVGPGMGTIGCDSNDQYWFRLDQVKN